MTGVARASAFMLGVAFAYTLGVALSRRRPPSVLEMINAQVLRDIKERIASIDKQIAETLNQTASADNQIAELSKELTTLRLIKGGTL